MIRLRYRSTSLFHFKRLDATNKAALTLPMPTPYAVRMALLAVSDDPAAAFDAVAAKKIVVAPAPMLVVNPCWLKILDLRRSDEPWNNESATAEYKSTMSMREYAHLPADGSADLSVYVDTLEGIEALPARVNYFGKRGCFFQFLGLEEADPLEGEDGLLYELEDFAPGATWDAVNVYNMNKPPRQRFLQPAQPKLRVHGARHTLYRF